MKKHLILPLALLILASCATAEKDQLSNAAGPASPESQGISSQAILDFIEALEESQPDAIHSLMIRRHNRVVAGGWWAPYSPESPHLLWSLSKSFTSTAIGMAQDEGLLNINDLVTGFFPDDLPEEISNNLQMMRIRDLLRMNTGHVSEPSWRNMQTGNWPRAFLAHEVPFKPSTHFLYNSMATYMCSAIIQKVSGKTTLDYLTPRLFEPLDIEKPTWDSDPSGVSAGGWGLSLRTEDISKFGQLLLQKGAWEGQQLVSREWVEEATGFQTANGSNPDSDWDQGYGYQFWQCRHHAFRGDGAFGQYCIVLPEQDAVIAMTSGSHDLQGILNIIWETLLPAMKDEILPADPEGEEKLKEKLTQLALSTVKGEESSPLAASISGKTYLIEENNLDIRAIRFDFDASPAQLSITRGEDIFEIPLAYRQWEKANYPWTGLTSTRIAVNGAWTDENTLEINLQYYESPQSMRFAFHFEEAKLTWETTTRAAFAPREMESLRGTYLD